MKTKILIGTAAFAGIALGAYIIKRIKSAPPIAQPLPSPKSHHLTDIFAKAKSHSH